jgi:hypothetical protein
LSRGNGGLDLAAVTDDPGVLSGVFEIVIGHGGHLKGVKVVKHFAEGCPVGLDRGPAESGLEDGPEQLLEVAAVVSGPSSR